MLPRSFAVVGLILFFFALRGYVMPHAHTTDAVNIEKMTRGNVSCILGTMGAILSSQYFSIMLGAFIGSWMATSFLSRFGNSKRKMNTSVNILNMKSQSELESMTVGNAISNISAEDNMALYLLFRGLNQLTPDARQKFFHQSVSILGSCILEGKAPSAVQI